MDQTRAHDLSIPRWRRRPEGVSHEEGCCRRRLKAAAHARAASFSMESGTRLNGGRRNSFANGAPAVVPTVGPEDPHEHLSLVDERLLPWTAASVAALPLSHRHASTYRAGRSWEAGRITGPRRSSETGRMVRAWHGGNGLGTALTRAQAALGADAALAPTSPREVRLRRSMHVGRVEDSAVRQRATADLSIGARDTTHGHLSHVVAAYQAAEARRQAQCQRDAEAAAAAVRRSSIRWGGGPAPPSNAKQGEAAADAVAQCEAVEDAAVPARRTHAKLGPMPYAPLCIRCQCDLVRVCVCCFI